MTYTQYDQRAACASFKLRMDFYEERTDIDCTFECLDAPDYLTGSTFADVFGNPSARCIYFQR